MTTLPRSRLKLLIGPAGCGKTRACLEEFESALNSSADPLSDDLLFLLPTAEHRSRIIDLVLRKNRPGFFNVRVSTFDRVVKQYLKLGGFDFASDVARIMILKEVVTQCKPQLSYFVESAGQPGFVEVLNRFVIELKESLEPFESLKKKFAELSSSFPHFKSKYEDLILIYEQYDAELKQRNVLDRYDALVLLKNEIVQNSMLKPNLSHVWIDGFSDFSKLQLGFIAFLAAHAKSITVTLSMDKDNSRRRALFETVNETRNALEHIGFQAEYFNHENQRASNPELKHIEQNLFLDQPKVFELENLNSHVQVFEAANLVSEIEMIAREIKRLVHEHQYHFSDIAVILRQAHNYMDLIQTVFDEFQIPVEVHERLQLRGNALARTLATFFQILLNNWQRKDLFNFLKSSYVHKNYWFSNSGTKTKLQYEDIIEFELKALEKGIFEQREMWLKNFDILILKEMAELEDRFFNIKTVEGFVSLVGRVVSQFGFMSHSEGDESQAQLDFAAVKRINALLEELKLKRKDKQNQITDSKELFKNLAEEFLILLDVDLFSLHAQDKNRVQLYNVSVARQKEYKVVFLAGLLEKSFPMQVREDPILSDAERKKLNASKEIIKEKLPRQSFERYLFYLGVTRASDYLILTYPRFDLEGKECLPSFYIEDVKRLFREIPMKKQHITEVLPDWDLIATKKEAAQRVVQNLWMIPIGPRNDHDDELCFALYNSSLHKESVARFMKRLYEPVEGKIEDQRVTPFFKPKRGTWSPTALEEYAECPYRYFAHKILELESQEEGIDIKRRGTILHDVLEQFFTWRRDKKTGYLSFEEALEFCMNEFEKAWEEEPLSGERYYRIQLEKKRMQEMIESILYLELVEEKPPISGLVPAYFEYEFRDLILRTKTREIKLRGKIDRIDVDSSRKFALVIDYKTGKPFKINALGNGTSLQLPFYLIAVEEKLGLKPLGGHLYALNRAYSTGFHHEDNLNLANVETQKKNKFSKKEFEFILKRSIDFADKFVRDIEQGLIPVKPRDCVVYCPYSSLCRIEKWRLEHIYRENEIEDKKQLAGSAK